jgi:hypothetical protein
MVAAPWSRSTREKQSGLASWLRSCATASSPAASFVACSSLEPFTTHSGAAGECRASGSRSARHHNISLADTPRGTMRVVVPWCVAAPPEPSPDRFRGTAGGHGQHVDHPVQSRPSASAPRPAQVAARHRLLAELQSARQPPAVGGGAAPSISRAGLSRERRASPLHPNLGPPESPLTRCTIVHTFIIRGVRVGREEGGVEPPQARRRFRRRGAGVRGRARADDTGPALTSRGAVRHPRLRSGGQDPGRRLHLAGREDGLISARFATRKERRLYEEGR